MRAGYLCIETNHQRPGLIRVTPPSMAPSGTRREIRYVARFNDVEAAQMHVQNGLHHQLIDLNNRIYQTGLIEAMAVIESDLLYHRRIWIDPTLQPEDSERLEQLTAARRCQRQRLDRIWQTVGTIAAAVLVMLLLGTF